MIGRVSFGEMRGNVFVVWCVGFVVDCCVGLCELCGATLRKITRKFNELSCLCVSVLAVLAWLMWCIGWFVWCCLLDQS